MSTAPTTPAILDRLARHCLRLLALVGNQASRLLGSCRPGVWLAVSLLAALALRLPDLLTAPLDPHERHYLGNAEDIVAKGSVLAMKGSVHGWLPAIGYGAILSARPDLPPDDLRWVQMAFSLGLIVLLYILGSAVASDRVGAAAAALFAVSPQGIIYGASLQPYSAHAFLCTLCALLYWKCAKEGHRIYYPLLAVFTAASIYNHPVAALYAAMEGLHAVTVGSTGRAARRAALISLAAGFLASVPGWAFGNPGHVLHILAADMPFFFAPALIGLFAIVLSLWDGQIERFDPVFHGLIPFLFFGPFLVFLPYMREQYLLPGTAIVCLVVGSALANGYAPARNGAVLLYGGLDLLGHYAPRLSLFR